MRWKGIVEKEAELTNVEFEIEGHGLKTYAIVSFTLHLDLKSGDVWKNVDEIPRHTLDALKTTLKELGYEVS